MSDSEPLYATATDTSTGIIVSYIDEGESTLYELEATADTSGAISSGHPGRDNNPGDLAAVGANLDYSGLIGIDPPGAGVLNADGSPAPGIVIFDDRQDGLAALYQHIDYAITAHSTENLGLYVSHYSGGATDDVEAAGFNLTETVGEQLTNETQIDNFVAAIVMGEGGESPVNGTFFASDDLTVIGTGLVNLDVTNVTTYSINASLDDILDNNPINGQLNYTENSNLKTATITSNISDTFSSSSLTFNLGSLDTDTFLQLGDGAYILAGAQQMELEVAVGPDGQGEFLFGNDQSEDGIFFLGAVPLPSGFLTSPITSLTSNPNNSPLEILNSDQSSIALTIAGEFIIAASNNDTINIGSSNGTLIDLITLQADQAIIQLPTLSPLFIVGNTLGLFETLSTLGDPFTQLDLGLNTYQAYGQFTIHSGTSLDVLDLIDIQPTLAALVNLTSTDQNGFDINSTIDTNLLGGNLSLSTEGFDNIILGAGWETLDASNVIQGLTFLPEALITYVVNSGYIGGNTIIGNLSASDAIDLGGGTAGPPSVFSGEVLIEYYNYTVYNGASTIAYDLGASSDDGLTSSGQVSVTDVSTIYSGGNVSLAVLDESSLIVDTENGAYSEDGTQYVVVIGGASTTIGFGTDIASMFDPGGQAATIISENLVLSGFTTIGIQDAAALNGVGAPFFGGTPNGSIDQQGDNQSVGSAASEYGENVDDNGIVNVAGGGLTAALIISGGTEYVSQGGVDSASEITGGGSQTILNGGTVYDADIVGPDTDFSGFSGGIYSSKAISQSFQIVQAGGTAIATFDDGQQVIYAGGTSIDTVLSQSELIDNPEDATEVISSGGIAFNTDAIANGGLTVISGGIATGGTVANNSEAFISGGTALNLDFENFGVLYVYSNGLVNNAVINDSEVYDLGGTIKNALFSGLGAYAQISQGLILSASIIAGGVDVIIGGSASASMIASGGQEFIEFGSSVDPTVGLGGEEYLDAAGTSISASIKKRGIEYVNSADTAISTTVSNGGYLIVSAGGTALSPTISSGGEIIVVNGATIENLTLLPGAQYISAGSAFDGSISIISSSFVGSGTVTSANVGYEEVEYVLSGGTVTGAILGPASSQIVYSGGTVISNTLNGEDDGSEQTLSGGISVDTLINEGEQVVVSGTAYATKVNGAYQAVSEMGYASGTILTAGNGVHGGVQSVASGGIAVGTIVGLYAEEDIDSGGVAYSSLIAGVAEVYTGGQLIGALISSGGSVTLDEGGSSSATTVLSGGAEEIGISYAPTAPESITTSDVVSSGGTYTVLSAGAVYDLVAKSGASIIAYSGAHISDLYLANGASLLTLPGAVIGFSAESPSTSEVEASILVETTSSSFTYSGVVSGLLLNGEEEYIYSGGTAIANQLVEGEQTVSAGGTAISNRGYGYIYVYSGGSVLENDLSPGSQEIVYSGGVDSGTTITNSGYNLSQEFLSGGIAYNDVIVSGAVQYIFAGAAVGTQNYNGGELAEDSGIISSETVHSGGIEAIQYGGVDSASIIGTGGQQDILDGGTAFDVDVESDGGQYVDPAGQSISTTVQNGGYEVVASAGQSFDTTVNSGGILIILNGGSATNLIQEEGGVVVDMPGATVSGALTTGMNPSRVPGFLVAEAPTTSLSFLTVYGVDYSDTYTFYSSDPSDSLPADSTEYVLSGAQAYNVVLTPGAQQVVLSGGLVDGLVTSYSYEQIDGGVAKNISVGYAGILEIYSAGVVIDSLIESYSHENIYDGGSSVSANIQYAAEEYVSAGGYTFDTTISSGGVAFISSGGGEYSAIILEGGEQIVSSGGSAYSSIIDGGTEIVSAGGLVVSTSVGANATQTLLNGASAYSALVDAGGIEKISGGNLYDATVQSGGIQNILKSGVVYDPLITGGTEVVSSGGFVQSGVIQSNGTQTLLFGATAYNIVVGAGGTEILSGGNLYDATVQSGGVILLLSGVVTPGNELEDDSVEIIGSGAAVQAPIVNAGTEIVEGKATSVTVNSPGTLIVAGGTVNSANVNYLAQITISGGTAVNVNGWTELVESGGVISGSTDDASELLSSGGTDIGTTITAYAAQDNYGGISYNDIVASDGAVTVADGGIAYNTVVELDGGQFITSGGTAFYTSVYGGEEAVAGGTEINSLLTDGAQINLYAAGQMLDNTLTSGALLELFNSGRATDTVLIGATVLDNYQGYLIDTAVNSGGTDIVFAGGTASCSMIYAGGKEIISGYSEAIATTVSQGGVQSVGSAGYAFGTVVQAGGLQVTVDGQINSSLIYGTAVVSSGGFAASSVITGGGIETILNGGSTLYDDVSGGGTAILAGGSASYGTVNSGGVLLVASNGQTYGMSIGPQGTESVLAGGTDQNAVVSGGALFVGADAVARDDVISSGGTEFVSGASAYSVSTTILPGGTEIVLGGGTAFDTYDDGVLVIGDGGSADVVLIAGTDDSSEANARATVAAAGARYSAEASPAFMAGSSNPTSAPTSAQVVFLQMTAESVATVTGADAGATAFNIVGDMTAGGASYTINDFIGSSSAIYLVNSTGTGPGDAVVSSMMNVGGNALITLSDGTNITLTGLATSALKVGTGANGITSIT